MTNSNTLKEFGQQLSAVQKQIYLYLIALVRHPADADDLLQETNRVIWEKADEFTPGSSLLAWAYKIAWFEVLAYRKREGRRPLDFNDERLAQLAEAASEAADESTSRRNALWSCFEKLSPRDRQLMASRYLDDSTAASLADQFGRPVKSIYQSLARIRDSLLACIERRIASESRS